MSHWRLVLLTLFSLSLPLAAQATQMPAKHHAAHAVHAVKAHKISHRTAQLHHSRSAG